MMVAVAVHGPRADTATRVELLEPAGDDQVTAAGSGHTEPTVGDAVAPPLESPGAATRRGTSPAE
jgi:hypothetical protein